MMHRPQSSQTTVSSRSCSSSTCTISTTSRSFYPKLLLALTWTTTFMLAFSCLSTVNASPRDLSILLPNTLGKRSFMEIECKGVYDKSIFARLDRICEDCYNLFREPSLHTLCRKNCFTSDYFKGCLDVLLLQDEIEQIQTWIKQLHGADPGV